ncbi:hypothetical protein [Actinoplanes sp. NPDC051494]|uniref:hypothetical protein n=1 Tax=Actinoplanes sp. NPDC051494 TaxID=3363907 RepID=UPI00379C9789
MRRAVPLLAVLLLAGCTTVITDPAALPQNEKEEVAGLGPRSPEGGYWPRTVQLGQSSELGSVVLDGQGFTLYRFDRDEADPPRSACVDDCAKRWPPVLAGESIKFQNLDPAVLGVVDRADGTRQVTVGGHALYRFADDAVPGQANGQGADDEWFVAGPDGSKAQA